MFISTRVPIYNATEYAKCIWTGDLTSLFLWWHFYRMLYTHIQVWVADNTIKYTNLIFREATLLPGESGEGRTTKCSDPFLDLAAPRSRAGHWRPSLLTQGPFLTARFSGLLPWMGPQCISLECTLIQPSPETWKKKCITLSLWTILPGNVTEWSALEGEAQRRGGCSILSFPFQGDRWLNRDLHGLSEEMRQTAEAEDYVLSTRITLCSLPHRSRGPPSAYKHCADRSSLELGVLGPAPHSATAVWTWLRIYVFDSLFPHL